MPDEMFTILPPPCAAHHRHDGAAGEEHRGDVDVHHLAPLLERDLGERPHRERRVEAGVVDEDVDRARSARRSRRPCRCTPCLVGDVDREPDAVREGGGRLLGALQVGDDDARALARRARRRSRGRCPARPPVTIATLPSSGPSADAARTGRDQDPVLLGVDQRLDLGEERLPVVARLQRARGAPPARRSCRSATGACTVESAPTSTVKAPTKPPSTSAWIAIPSVS